jgi:hypothetical protein
VYCAKPYATAHCVSIESSAMTGSGSSVSRHPSGEDHKETIVFPHSTCASKPLVQDSQVEAVHYLAALCPGGNGFAKHRVHHVEASKCPRMRGGDWQEGVPVVVR